MNNPLISIIIPVYNGEKYLSQCLDSIAAQTYTNFECLIVNDGSSDGSAAILDGYAARDGRFKVFHKENGGVSSARNLALAKAAGEWITFVDADDWIENQYLEHLTNSAQSNNADIVIAFATRVHDEKNIIENYPSYSIPEEDFSRLFIDNDLHWHTSPWSKLYKTSIIRESGLKFTEGMHIGEDGVFLFTYLTLCKSIVVTSYTDYHYLVLSSNSLTKRVFSLESELLSHNTINKVIDTMIEKKSVNKPKALANLNWLKAYYIKRVINCLYNNDIDTKKRLSTLNSLDLELYRNNIHPKSFIEHLDCYLLKYRMLHLYDTLRYCKKIITR